MAKRFLTFSNILTGLLLVLFVAMMIKPEVKAFFIRGLMQVGLFRPDIPGDKEQAKTGTSLPGAVAFLNEDGTRIDLGSLRGKVVFINFWATWCPPCIAEMPSVQELYEGLKADTGIVFLIVDADRNLAKARAFMDRHGYTLPLHIAEGAMPAALYEGTLPTTAVLNPEGQIVMKHSGAANYGAESFREFLKGLRRAQ